MKDGKLPVSARSLAIGVLGYLKSPIDIIPDKLKMLGLVDDVLIMIVGLSIIVPLIPEERLSYYKQRYKEVERVHRSEQILKSFLGIIWDRLKVFTGNLHHTLYRENTTEEVVESETLQEDLYDDTMEFVAGLNLEPNAIDSEFEKLSVPETIIGMLANGMEDAEKQQQEELEKQTVSKSKSSFRSFFSKNKTDADRD